LEEVRTWEWWPGFAVIILSYFLKLGSIFLAKRPASPSRTLPGDQLRNLSKFQVDSQVYESDLACLQGSAVNTNTSVVVEFRILDNSLIS
jgi:hypothetical protein